MPFPQVDRIESHSFLAERLASESVIVDLGTNRGLFAMAMIERYGCRVFGVEPVPALVAAMPRHDRFKLTEAAIAAQTGPMLLSVNPSSCASATFSEDGAEAVPVIGIMLRSLLQELGLTRVDLLKVDIEGAELGLFESCTEEDLSGVQQITVEFHDFIDAMLGPAVVACIARLESMGYRRITFSLDNTDVLFVRPYVGLPIAFEPYVVVRYKYLRGILRRVRRLLKR